ncbi:MAG: YraN family protein [Actinomycetota bacterium]|nr:YraN family protein [Actinomycetota bacterium]
MSSSRPGRRAEQRAVWWYRLRGYRILATNVWVAGYELDIVVRRGRHLIFCEVKEKRGERFGDPLEMVDEEKQRRLRRAAKGWLARHPETAGLRVSFDVVAVRSGQLERVAEAF